MGAAVGDDGRVIGKLQRGKAVVRLADGGAHRFRRIPLLPAGDGSLVFPAGHHARHFTGHVGEPGGTAEAVFPGVMGEGVDAGRQAGPVEINVARYGQGAVKIEGAVRSFIEARLGIVGQGNGPGTVRDIVGAQFALFKGGGGSDHFKSGADGKSALQSEVGQRRRIHGHQLCIILRDPVQIEGRVADHGQDRPAVGIHHYRGRPPGIGVFALGPDRLEVARDDVFNDPLQL